jgi:hypothetical protein
LAVGQALGFLFGLALFLFSKIAINTVIQIIKNKIKCVLCLHLQATMVACSYFNSYALRAKRKCKHSAHFRFWFLFSFFCFLFFLFFLVFLGVVFGFSKSLKRLAGKEFKRKNKKPQKARQKGEAEQSKHLLISFLLRQAQHKFKHNFKHTKRIILELLADFLKELLAP